MGKVTILQKNGFTDCSTAILCESTPVPEIKRILLANPHSLFIVGGAMMNGFPDLMADILTFIEKECPTILVHKTSKPDFDPEAFEGGKTPTEEQVNKSALNICLRYLAEGKDL